MEKEVSLRNFTTADLDDFLGWATDPEVTKFLTWEPYKSREDALTFLATVAIPHSWFKAICVNGKVIGSITLTVGQGIHRCLAELGYCIGREYWGHGYMTQAVKLALATGFRDLGVERIQALVRPEHTRSQRVLEKAGFEREAYLRRFVRVSKKNEERIADCFLFAAFSEITSCANEPEERPGICSGK